MMRVAYVSADLGVPIFGRKGCSIHAQEVLRALLRNGAEVDLFTTSGQGQPPEGLESIRLHALPRPAISDAAAREQECLALNPVIRDALDASGPFDFVYERYSLWSYAAMEFARDQGLPGLIEINAPLIEEQAQYRVLKDRDGAEKAAGRVFDAASSLLAVSDEVAAYLRRFPAASGKVLVVPNGVRPERFPERVEPAVPAGEGVFTVGFVGTLKAWHGLSILVEAFALMRPANPESRLLLVGDGPEQERILADIRSRGLEQRVILQGAVAPDQVPAFLASMDVAVAPYPNLDHFYFSPLKVYEYMAAGLPVVASRIGQLEKILEPGVSGLLVAPGDARELAQALERLRSDEHLRACLGSAARTFVLRECTWEKVVQRIIGIAGLAGRTRAHQPATPT